MTTQTKDAGKEQRVVLNLTTTQARELKAFISELRFDASTQAQEDLMGKIKKRLEKTLTKQQIAQEHPEFTKEQIKRACKTCIGGSDGQN